ncbi:MAG: deoxyribonuclease IV [Rubrobacteraceae bacterium]
MSKRTNSVGRHLPTSGGLKKTLQKAEEQACETVQIFVSNPQGWADPAPRSDAASFVEGARKIGLSPIVVHAKYLINLASFKEDQRERSVQTLAKELVAAGDLGADLVVVHSGSHGGDGEKVGMQRLVESLLRAKELVDGEGAAEVVIENSVGAGTQLCSTFETLADAADRAGVRVCVDTAHAFVAGYDLSASEGVREVAEELRENLDGKIALFHLNDARNELGSHRDGHRRIGEGQIPTESWKEFFAALPGIPVVMETPYDTPEVDAEQIQLVKELAGGLPNASK